MGLEKCKILLKRPRGTERERRGKGRVVCVFAFGALLSCTLACTRRTKQENLKKKLKNLIFYWSCKKKKKKSLLLHLIAFAKVSLSVALFLSLSFNFQGFFDTTDSESNFSTISFFQINSPGRLALQVSFLLLSHSFS